jgi:hypothetical protein
LLVLGRGQRLCRAGDLWHVRLHLRSRASRHALLWVLAWVLHLVLRRWVGHEHAWLRRHRLWMLRVLLWVLLGVLPIWGRRPLGWHRRVLLLRPCVVHGSTLLQLRRRGSVHAVLIMTRG